MKLTIAILFCAAIATASSAPASPVGAVESGRFFFPSSSFFLNVFLQSDIQRILATYDLSDELSDSLLEVLTDAQAGIEACSVSALPWIQKPCIMSVLKRSKAELAVLEAQIAAYLATTTTTATT